ncbi:MAG: universal stress protein [Ferruginibacter sp.]|nr:universal stress protein [Ferruginibacter sp.]
MKKILVTTDFSAIAQNAVNYAADMAVAVKADLVLLHIVQTPVTYSEVPLLLNVEDLMRTAEKDLQDIKENLKHKTENRITINIETGIGSFFNELKDICERIKPYAIVMGSQGKTAAEHLLFGSHATHAIRELGWPVITVPPTVTFSSIKKVGLATDLTKVVETTPIDEIKMLVNDFNAELHILNIGRKEVFSADIVFESGLMQEMTMSMNPKFHFIAKENVEEAIIEFVDQKKIDLLIVIPKRHNLLDRLVHTSLSKGLVLHSHIPVMAVH